MKTGFEGVGQSTARSTVGHIARFAGAALAAAWQSSVPGRLAGAGRHEFASATVTARVRWCATVVGVAAVGHLVLRTLMSATVAPAMPLMLFAGVAALAALVAAQPEAFIRAWRSSRTARTLQRKTRFDDSH